MSEMAASLENTCVCCHFPLQFFVRRNQLPDVLQNAYLASYISSKNQCITFCVAVCIAKFDILEYLKHQNAYAIMPVGKMK